MAKDMQKETSGFYPKAINKVGVRNMMIPLTIARMNGQTPLVTIAEVSSYCDLNESVKGIHMSRISRTINEVLAKNSSFGGLQTFVQELRDNQGSTNAYIKAKFPFIYESNAPVSGTKSLEPVNVILESTIDSAGGIRNYVTVETTEMSLCPCSKEMSLLENNLTLDELHAIQNKLPPESPLYKKVMMAGFGAHNQKSRISITVQTYTDEDRWLWIEDLVSVARQAASCPTWSTLKRPDEKYVTEVSYLGGYFDEDTKQFCAVDGTGPKFVEDIVRDAAKHLDWYLDKKIIDYVVVCNNEESIHSGDILATAVLTAGRDLR